MQEELRLRLRLTVCLRQLGPWLETQMEHRCLVLHPAQGSRDVSQAHEMLHMRLTMLS